MHAVTSTPEAAAIETNALSADERGGEWVLSGNGKAVTRLKKQVASAARAAKNSVLLVGPSGTGHAHVARAVHEASGARGHFVRVHCARLQTADDWPFLARDDRTPGLLTRAHGGTLFLDGIEQLPRDRQEELHRLIDAGITRNQEVRLIAGTRKAPDQLSVDRRLLERLQKVTIALPTLDERWDDLPRLATLILRAESERAGIVVADFDEHDIEELRKHEWRGHLDELFQVVRHATLTARSGKPRLRLSTGGASLGGYRLIRKLGEGAHGEVWEARHQLLARPAAIKIVNGENEPDSMVRELFEREARVTASLRSPHTVTLYDFGLTTEGSAYYVMELLEGCDLGTLLDREGPLDPARVICLLRQACRSLIEAHHRGLVHRDIKHENLFVCRLGDEYDFLKVLDFGVVKLDSQQQDFSQSLQRLTLSECGLVGTLGYMAPEAIHRSKKEDLRADIYSLGCVAFEALTACHLFEADSEMALISAHIQQEPEPPSQVLGQPLPPGLDELVLRCLEKDPNDRYQSMEALDDALEAIEQNLEKPWNRRLARAAWTQANADEWP